VFLERTRGRGRNGSSQESDDILGVLLIVSSRSIFALYMQFLELPPCFMLKVRVFHRRAEIGGSGDDHGTRTTTTTTTTTATDLRTHGEIKC